MHVTWDVYDGDRNPEFSKTTMGSYRTPYGGRTHSLETAIRFAFEDAAKDVLKAQEFVKLANAPRKSSANFEEGALADSPDDLRVRWSSGDESAFSKRVRELKAATVTIRVRQGHGSGFLIDDGYILTNHHVVKGIETARVVLGKKLVDARVIARSRRRDIALLAIVPDHGITPLRNASRPVETGETIFIIGTPLDESLSQTVTRGILSAVRKKYGARLYQTDAAVNPGNSGGPALDEQGNVIGLAVSGAFTKDEGSMNINFLIPIEEALRELGVIGLPAAFSNLAD